MSDEITAPLPEKSADKPELSRIQEIKDNIRAGEAWLKSGHGAKDSRDKEWKESADMLRCNWGVDEKDEGFEVNTIFSNYHTKRPTLFFKNPYVNVTAKKPNFQTDELGEHVRDENGRKVMTADNYNAARLMQVALNHELKQIGLKHIVKRCVGHCLAPYGIAWAKVGYQDLSASAFNNDRDNAVNFWVDWCDPRDIVFDWRAVEGKKMRWIAHRFTSTRDECEQMGLKIPPGYNGRLPDHLEDRAKTAESHALDGSSMGTQTDMIVWWEYHDLVGDTIDCVLIDGPSSEWFFMKETKVEAYPFEGSSILPLVLTPDDDDLIGTSDVKPIKKQAIALNRMRKREVHHIENYGTGVVYEDGAVTPAALKEYNKTPFGWALKVAKGFFGKVKMEGTPSMGSDHYNMSSIHKDEIRTTLGITDYQQGGADVQRKATEAQIISSAATLRVEENRDSIAEFIIEIARRIMAMIQEFADEDYFVALADDELDDDFIEVLKESGEYNPKIPFLHLPRERIQGEFELDTNVEDMIQQPKEVRAASLARTLQAVGSNPLFTQKFVEENDIGKVISDMFELNGIDLKKYRKGGPTQITAVVENLMFERGMEVPEPHRKDDDHEHIIVNGQAKAKIEQQLQAIQAQIQKLQQGVAMVPQMMAGNPAAAQQVQQATDQQLQQLSQQSEPLSMILRRINLHIQKHAEQDMRKQGESALAGAGQGMPGQLPQGPAQQATPAQAPGPGTVV